MRGLFVIAFACLPISAAAQISDQDKAEIVERADCFSRSILAGEGIEGSIAATFPPFAETAARAFDIESTDALFERMRQGYAYSTSQLEVIEHDMNFDRAVFGMTGDWTWGIVPYMAQSRWIETQETLGQTCAALLVFGQDGVWYLHSMDARSDGLLRATMPEFEFLDDPYPSCDAGTS